MLIGLCSIFATSPQALVTPTEASRFPKTLKATHQVVLLALQVVARSSGGWRSA
ncbi:hypothetical protein DUNSADRAFT_1622 [Dunaliella salina]|uniref:Encoded protein n=1 Tax=Dunaliella salina TaxID=3046 RepID=A0ABQ7H8K8_DUNSA|nr:hypothetical protein DUNSADRAFT_1622 [Dunaliella salina]|eukprot:KAF5843195.1 hypothetical protein DUNSADRAFT_1622 [Dunaliella salina]